jgi:hypothetical protein
MGYGLSLPGCAHAGRPYGDNRLARKSNEGRTRASLATRLDRLRGGTLSVPLLYFILSPPPSLIVDLGILVMNGFP